MHRNDDLFRVEKILSYHLSVIQSLQLDSGGFSSVIIEDQSPGPSTVYFPNIILGALKSVPEKFLPFPVIRKSLAFIQSHTTKTTDTPDATTGGFSTWNYLAGPSPYPDDLDDTLLSLETILYWNPILFPNPTTDQQSQTICSIVKNLTASEAAPGGPYYTWLVSENLRVQWNNIDPVVNAVVMRILCSLGVSLPRLEQYLIDQLALCTLPISSFSEFYDQPLFCFYLISKVNHPETQSAIRASFENFLKKYLNYHPPNSQKSFHNLFRELLCATDWAYIIITAHNLNIDLTLLLKELFSEYYSTELLIQNFISLVEQDPITTDELFIERKHGNTIDHCGCLAFSHALICEAISIIITNTSTCDTLTKNVLVDSICHTTHLDKLIYEVKNILLNLIHSRSIQSPYIVKHIETVLGQNNFYTLLPFHVYTHLLKEHQSHITEHQLLLLCSAHILGIVAFTLQDAIIDREVKRSEILTATTCITLMHELIDQVKKLHKEVITSPEVSLFSEPSLFSYVYAMHNSLHCETEFTAHTYASLPQTGDYYLRSLSSCYEKSVGIIMIPELLLTLCAVSETTVSHYQEALTRALTLRQLMDDLHDWKIDISNNHYNPISAMIISQYSLAYPDMLPDTVLQRKQYIEQLVAHESTCLDKIFWKHCFESIHLIAYTITKECQTICNYLYNPHHPSTNNNLCIDFHDSILASHNTQQSSSFFISREIDRLYSIIQNTQHSHSTIQNFIRYYHQT